MIQRSLIDQRLRACVGTWIPLERAVDLAKQYHIDDVIRPIIELDTGGGTPPPAPKHTIKPSQTKLKKQDLSALSRAGSSRRDSNLAATAGPPVGRGYSSAAATNTTPNYHASMGEVGGPSSGVDPVEESDGEGAISATPSVSSSSSRTPSPITQSNNMLGTLNDHLAGMYPDQQQPSYSIDGMQAGAAIAGQKRKAEEEHDGIPSSSRSRLDDGDYHNLGNGHPHAHVPGGPEAYANVILDYFITEKARIPECLIDPPPDFDANVSIDDDGHTALHWACAMGRLRVVKLLLSAGADIFRVNQAEQTALMRSVMFSNNYDVRKFPELYQLLHRSTLNIDKNNRTVFHHIADVALTKGKTHAARYYMETILSHLEDYPRELEDVINFQDEEGETALTLAARARSKRLVKALLDHGANPHIKNRDDKSAEDYILEDERFRSSPNLGGQLKLGGGGGGGVDDIDGPGLRTGVPSLAPQLYHSQSAQQASGKYTVDMTTMLDDLARSYDTELQQKEKDITQAEALLVSLRSDIDKAKVVLSELQAKSADLQTQGERVAGLQNLLEDDMGRRYRAGWQTWLSHQQERERAWEAAGRPETDEWRDVLSIVKVDDSNPMAVNAEEAQLSQHVEQGRRRRMEMFKAFVRQQGDIGTGEKMASYRKLIASACGGMEPSQVDKFLVEILDVSLEVLLSLEERTLLFINHCVHALDAGWRKCWGRTCRGSYIVIFVSTER